VQPTFFGLNAQDWPSTGAEPTFPFGSYSNFDNKRTHWRSLHSASNTINWANLDAVVAGVQAQGVTDGLYVLYGCPTFLAQAGQAAQAGPYSGLGEGSFPTDLTQLTYFCQQFAARNASTWGGFFKQVQLFNEPEGGNFSGTASTTNFFWGSAVQYVDMLWTAYTALKTAAPSLEILTPGTYAVTTFATWLDAVGATTSKHGYECFDAVALHPYHAKPNPTYSGRGDFFSLYQGGLLSAQAILAARGRTGLRYYASEYGLDSSGSSGVVATFLALTAAERSTYVQRLRMSAARSGFAGMYLWSLGNTANLCGDLSADTTGVIAGERAANAAMSGKTIISGGWYPDGREQLTFSDGSTYVV